MEGKIATLTPFFDKPAVLFHIREIAKITGISHTAARKHIRQLEKEGFLVSKPTTPYKTYRANSESGTFRNLKLYYNLEKLRKSGLIEALERHYSYPVIVLFGSFAKALDDEKSDIDLCVVSEINRPFDAGSYEKALGRTVSIHLFSRKSWETAKRKNPDLINSICNGLVVSGQLEVL